MKQIKLIKLALRNFKGIEEFTFELDGNNAKVYGDNATGKTTLFDAFTWVLFDKDSSNKSQFEIKTLDENNEPIHGLEHEVEAAFDVDGKQITLRKVYAEKWTKKRGAATAEFTGHTTSYYIDGVPSKKKEYTDQVSEIMDEEAFKLLTNPNYFNEVLGWKERREILLNVCGDISDDEVIASKEDLSDLLDVLQGRTIEEHRRVIAARRTEINKELDRIPIRIDEVQRSKPEIPSVGIINIQNKIKQVKSSIEDKEKEIQSIRSGGEISAKEKQINELEGELLEIKNKANEAVYGELEGKRKELNKTRTDIESTKFEIDRLERTIDFENKQIEQLTEEMNELRKKWKSVDAREFEHSHEETCPTCKQSLPVEQIKEARETALEAFNTEKASELETINQAGVTKKEMVEKLSKNKDRLERDKLGMFEKLEELEQDIREKMHEIDEIQKSVEKPEESMEYRSKLNQIVDLKDKIKQIEESQYEAIKAVEEEIRALKEEQKEQEQEALKFEQAKRADERIKELSDFERQLATEFEQLEHELYLTEEFIRTKVTMLETKINSKFKYAQFKLFDVQVNGALNEVCETTYKGVPYSTGLNNAMKINVGLDIINTLSEHYGFSAPIFVDNAEAVTKLIDTTAQIVKLVVSEDDKQLRMEVEKEQYREVI